MIRTGARGGALCVTLVLLQRGGMPMPMPGSPAGGTVSMQHAMQMEAQRRMHLDEATRARFVVVREEQRERTGRVIGIDLGTTNSCISYLDPVTMRPKIIPSPTGSWVFPTAITFDKNHQIRLFGEEARACVRTSASATLCSGKRLIGRGFGELGRIQSQLNRTNMLTVNEKGEVAVEIMGRTYTVVHIMAMFLRYLKQEAEKFLKESVDLVVVSVPAYFTPQQKVATEDAALCAGFDVLEVIDEPSAACLSYTVLHKRKGLSDAETRARLHRSVVFDLGGGTLDCAIMEHDTKRSKFKLVATHGDPLLGGNDWDSVLSLYFAQQFEKKWRVPIEEEEGNVGQGVATTRNLLLEAEKAKIHFTHSTEPYYGYNRAFHFSEKLRDIVPLEATLTYEQYVDMTRSLRVRCVECLNKLFEHVDIKPQDVDNILLVGAMTRDPPIRATLEDYFQKPVAPEDSCPADYAVAFGAAIRGGMLQGNFPELSSNTRFVSGTVQSQRTGSLARRLWSRFRNAIAGGNPNAIGQRWRGRARGLTDEEIASYAKELVEFEAQCERRLLLERAENDANFVMRRVSADSNKRQGMQEKRIKQLAEQLKFWQYMVHNFHDHEEQLMRTVKDLEQALDELDGLASDNTSSLTSAGTIDFGGAHGIINRNLGIEGEPALSTASAAPGTEAEGSAGDSAAKEALRTKGSEGKRGTEVQRRAPKVLRRDVPLPKGSSLTEELVEAGHPALRGVDVVMTEATRTSFFESQVEERAWREPPTPPGEAGSWQEVKKAMDAGEDMGAPLSPEELQRQMTADEMLQALMHYAPIDDPVSEEHEMLNNQSLDLQTMTVVSNNVCMDTLRSELRGLHEEREREEREGRKVARSATEETSAKMFR